MSEVKTLQQVAAYFHDCYQSDFRAMHLLDFYGKKVKYPLIDDFSKLLTGEIEKLMVSEVWATQVWEELVVYGKEKSLICGTFFLSGETKVIGKRSWVCAPLLLFPVELFLKDYQYYISIDVHDVSINPAFFDNLKSSTKDETITFDYLQNQLPTGYLNKGNLQKIITVLADSFPGLDLSAIRKFPSVELNKNLLSYRKRDKSILNFSLRSAIGIGIVKKSTGSRGVLNELTALSWERKFSKPLRTIFGELRGKTSIKKRTDFHIPATLSEAQENIISSAEKNTLTMVIGPPGTGKSFTIAALAVDYLSQQKSVLIAARNVQAANVVADKIEQDFGLKHAVVRAGKSDYLRFLKKRLENLLNGYNSNNRFNYEKYAQCEKSLKKVIKKIIKLEKQIGDSEILELEYGQFFANYRGNLWQRIKKFFVERKIESLAPFWELLFEYENLLKDKHELITIISKMSFLLKVNLHIEANRKHFQKFLKGLKKRQGNSREELFGRVDFKRIFKAFPIWIVNTADIDRILPLEKELFDLVIIDEASQCDIASAIPILQRGRRTAIVGDPKQLRHLSFLPYNQQNIHVQKYNLKHLSDETLNYRDHSILDVVSDRIEDSEQVHFLDEHYRSLPEIIAFSNEHFYDNNLNVMTATPTNQGDKSVFLHQVEGKRYKNGYNKIEADIILKKVKAMMEKEANLPIEMVQSIGILSPFREQVNHLQNKVQKQFSIEEIERHRLLIGTPHAFQGEEKEVMFLSFAIDENTHPSTFQYLNREDVFNVSITRARSEQHVFLSAKLDSLSSKYLLTRYLQSIAKSRLVKEEQTNLNSLDLFMEEVEETLKNWGLEQIKKAYSIAGLEIDMVIVHQGKTYCIDLVGYPGEFEYAIPLHRWKLLARLGRNVFALPYSLWHLEREECESALREFLEISSGK